MKKIIFLILFLVNVNVFGAAISGAPTIDLDTSVDNLLDVYSSSFPSKALIGLRPSVHFAIINRSSTAVCCASPVKDVPVAGAGTEYCVPASYAFAWDNISINGTVYCRSQSGTISSGIISFQTW